MIYLDNAATTRPYESTAELLKQASLNVFENASALHDGGINAEDTLENARKSVAAAAGTAADEIYFTPGGTFSNNLAILGFLSRKRSGRIITSGYEHPSVSNVFKNLEGKFEVIYLKPENGVITPNALQEAMTVDTVFVSIMHINNETGAVMPVKELAAVAHSYGAAIHIDAIQSFMKEPFSYSCVDMASFSAHKTHGPKGIGALYLKKSIHLSPITYGGGQEKGLCSGTLSVPLATAWADALEKTDVSADYTTVSKLNAYTKKRLIEAGAIIISPDNASPYIISAVFDGYLAENLLHYLSQNGIYVSTGSACSSKHGSRVYSALGLEKYGKSALRISFCAQNTESEIDTFISVLSDGLNNIRRIS